MSTGRFKTLEDTFDLDPASSIETDDAVVETEEAPTDDDIKEAMAQAKDLEQQFIKMDGYDVHDKEMDELANLAVNAHKDLQDLGMNVEIKHAGEIFSSSSQMLKIAVDAKNNKVEKKLKLLKLQLDKLKIDKTFDDPNKATVDGKALRLDRNDILQQIKDINNKDK
jgi:RNase P/RNase MRP subunit p29